MPTSASKRTGPYAPAVLVDLNKDLVVPKAVAEGLATNAWGTFEAGSSGMFLESFGVKVDVVMDQDLEQIVEDDRYSVEVGFAVTKQAARRFDELFSASVKGIEKRIQELDEGGDRKSKVLKALSAWKKAQDLGVQPRQQVTTTYYGTNDAKDTIIKAQVPVTDTDSVVFHVVNKTEKIAFENSGGMKVRMAFKSYFKVNYPPTAITFVLKGYDGTVFSTSVVKDRLFSLGNLREAKPMKTSALIRSSAADTAITPSPEPEEERLASQVPTTPSKKKGKNQAKKNDTATSPSQEPEGEEERQSPQVPTKPSKKKVKNQAKKNGRKILDGKKRARSPEEGKFE